MDSSSADVLDAMELAKADGSVQASSSPRIVVAASEASSFSSDCSGFFEDGHEDDDNDEVEAVEGRELHEKCGVDGHEDDDNEVEAVEGRELDEKCGVDEEGTGVDLGVVDDEEVDGRDNQPAGEMEMEMETGEPEEEEEVLKEVLGGLLGAGEDVVRAKPRSMTLVTEDTASPPSRRVSQESASASSVAVDDDNDPARRRSADTDYSVEQQQQQEKQSGVEDEVLLGVVVAPRTPSPPRYKTEETMMTPVPSPEDSGKIPGPVVDSPTAGEFSSPLRREAVEEALRTAVPCCPEESRELLSRGVDVPAEVSGGVEVGGVEGASGWGGSVGGLGRVPSLNGQGEEREEGDKHGLMLEVRGLSLVLFRGSCCG